MKRSPAITASRRPRSEGDSPRTRCRGRDVVAGWQVARVGGEVRRPERPRLAPAAVAGSPPVAGENPGRPFPGRLRSPARGPIFITPGVRSTRRRPRRSGPSKRLMPGSSWRFRRDPDHESVDQAAAAVGGRRRRHPAAAVRIELSPKREGPVRVDSRAGQGPRAAGPVLVRPRDDDRQLAAGHHGRPLQHIGADAPSAPPKERRHGSAFSVS